MENSKSVIANITIDPGRLKEIDKCIELLKEAHDIFQEFIDGEPNYRKVYSWKENLKKFIKI